MTQIPWLDPEVIDFPSPKMALDNPNGLLAAGGDLSVQRLLQAYRQGIFPWYEKGQPILWWSPSPRAVLMPDQLHTSRSLRKTLRQGAFTVTADTVFREVMTACADTRQLSPHQDTGTWITAEMIKAYCELHRRGIAHSIEAWQGDRLVGGLYGLALGKVFFGESMFSRVSNASKVAFVHLVQQLSQWGYQVIDCQVSSQHLTSLGVQEIPRAHFQTLLIDYIKDSDIKNCQTYSPWELTLEQM